MNSLPPEEKTGTKADITGMGREINLDSILALDAEIIRLKRTRNSLLNITRIPPEILGHIFRFNITEVGDPHFAKIPKGSYNFLFVCHHWYQVALHTPELWSSWGNELTDWRRRYLRSGTSALDLVLNGRNYIDEDFDEDLRAALRDRAARDVIRKVHLRSDNTELLAAIISSLIPEGEDVRPSSIESIVLSDVDVSDLFARHRFPKLRNLHLSGRFKISSWDYLKSSIIALTDLSLDFTNLLLNLTGLSLDFADISFDFIDTVPSSAVPTTSQILSLLASNPNIRSLTLSALVTNDDGEDGPRLQLPLRHLEQISLTGAFHHVFPILRRLEFPERMDNGEITLRNCKPREVLEAIGPYIGDYLRRDGRFRDRLWIFVSSNSRCISLHASVVRVEYHGPSRLPQYDPPYGRFKAMLSPPIPRDARKKLCIDILAILPQESIVGLETDLPVAEETVVAMPNLESLYLEFPVVADGFLLPDPNGLNAHKKLLPSLQRLYLEDAEAKDDNWDPLVTYLAHQTSGGQAVSLNVFGAGVHICSKVIKRIEGLVEELIYLPDSNQECPFDECP